MDPALGAVCALSEQGLGLHLGCAAMASLLSRLTCRAQGKQGGTAECGRAAWPQGQECPRCPFGGVARSPAFHPAETRRGPGFSPSFPWSQEALKGTQATSLGLATSTSAHCSGLGPAGTNLPDFCLSSAPQSLSGFGPQQPQGCLHSTPWPSGDSSCPLQMPAGPAALAPGSSYPWDSSLPLAVTQVLTQSLARPVRGAH